MKSYYYEENNTQKGPVSLEELKEKINQKTRVWTKGLPNWIEAQNLEELRTIFNLSTPPPLNSSKKEKSFALKRNVIFFIVFVVLVLVFFYWNNTRNNSSSDYYLQTQREKYIIRSSWRERITLEYDKPAVDYAFGGIANFEIQVDNNTNYEIDVVEVVISYIKKIGNFGKKNICILKIYLHKI